MFSLHTQLLPPYFLTLCPSLWPPLPTTVGRGLAKVMNCQPEHVIGAHPCIVNVLQDETLMKTHDRVIICLQIHRKKKKTEMDQCKHHKEITG